MKYSLYFINLLIFTCFHAQVFSDVKSTNGAIRFDRDSNLVPEMTLNANGFGIFNQNPSSNLHVSGNAIISQQLTVGSSTLSQSNLHVQGSLAMTSEVISSSTTLSQSSVVLVDTSSDNILLTLPEAGNVLGRIYTIKKTSTANRIIIQGVISTMQQT